MNHRVTAFEVNLNSMDHHMLEESVLFSPSHRIAYRWIVILDAGSKSLGGRN